VNSGKVRKILLQKQKAQIKDLGIQMKWYNTFIACERPWVPSPILSNNK
jgi:hypothetical protein